MTNTVSTGGLEQKALELLPWYVNGTLEGEERELVARQVLASLTCRKELERLRQVESPVLGVLVGQDEVHEVAELDRLRTALVRHADTPPQDGEHYLNGARPLTRGARTSTLPD